MGKGSRELMDWERQVRQKSMINEGEKQKRKQRQKT